MALQVSKQSVLVVIKPPTPLLRVTKQNVLVVIKPIAVEAKRRLLTSQIIAKAE